MAKKYIKFEFVPKKAAKAMIIIHAFEDYRYGWWNRLIRFFRL